MQNYTRICVALLLVCAPLVLLYVLSPVPSAEPVEVPKEVVSDPKNATYSIDGTAVTLTNGLSEVEVPGAGARVVTRYFGNELYTDLNDDGREDVVFLLTQETGGSGTFFYAVAAINTEEGFIGSDGYLLGDRIAPQTTHERQDPTHKNVVVVNFADRYPDEPMTTRPSLGKSAYLKLDDTNHWAIVEPDFPGEADPNVMTLGMKTWVWQRALYNDGRELLPAQTDAFTLAFADDGTVSITTDCNSAGGAYTVDGDTLQFADLYSTLMYCDGSQEAEFLALMRDVRSFHFIGRGELVLSLLYDSGTVTFR